MRMLVGFSVALTALALLQQPSFGQQPSKSADGLVVFQAAAVVVDPPAPESKSTVAPACAPASCAPCCDDACCCWNSRFGVYADLLYLKARGLDLTYAQIRNGCMTSAVPNGPQGVLDDEYTPAFRIGFEYALTKCSSIEADFAQWENQTHSAISASGVNVINSLITLPGTASCATDSTSASATLGLETRWADLVYKHLWCGDYCHSYLNWFVGVRYADLRQDLSAEFILAGATAVNTHVNFDGAGPRIGLEGSLKCGNGVFLYGRGAANFIAGHFGADYSQFNVFAGDQGMVDYKNDRIVPILELELGVGWTNCKGNVSVMAGYYLAGWFNVVTTNDFISAVAANNFTTNGNNLSDTISFDGLMLRVEFKF